MISGRDQLSAACHKTLSTASDVRIVEQIGPERKAELATAVARRRPRILLIDIAFVRDSRYSLITILRRLSPKTRFILVCERAARSEIMDALSHGVLGYLETKDIDKFLVKLVRAVNAGEAWVPRHIISLMAKRLVELSA